ncbi:MAG TPA: 2-oxoglutarate dehydrogenase E1 component [Vicinamibacterales bacterium]|nr:2-oxoglutarate dehydrogenase E1 component [Vicinamibacterales bacterium]
MDPANLAYLERVYAEYLRNQSAVPESWQRYFARGPVVAPAFGHSAVEPAPAALQERLDMLVRNYRVRGHIVADLDPLGRKRPEPPELNVSAYGFTEEDMARTVFFAGRPLPLRDVIQRLRNTYCRAIGVQFMHIDDTVRREWLQDRMEQSENTLHLSRDEQIRILKRLTDAIVFEEFVRHNFVGARTFSLEGSESLIPLLDLAIEKASEQGVREIVIGMAHRGRLNVLANITRKSPREIFREFQGIETGPDDGHGDVRYHLGYGSDWITSAGRTVHLSLSFNPSHVEFVDPIVLGRTRAKQDRAGDVARERGLSVLIHGDAAFAGEGIVQETLNLSELTGYRVGGTLHVVVNNQIGFTTPAEEGRSTVYSTDVAKMLQIPIFHVNGEDPEAVAFVVRLALDFRATFRTDVVVDMLGYRRRGHNESDEPSFTQPVLYREINTRPSVRDGYLQHLLKLGEISADEADQIAADRRDHFEHELNRSRNDVPRPPQVWTEWVGGPEANAVDVETGVTRDTLSCLLDAQTRLPADFHPHPKIRRGLERRHAMARGEQPLDWPAAESLAFASLAVSGMPIRLTGQDSARGTFSQRHAVLHDEQDGHQYVPLRHLADGQAPVDIYNSPLSELGVLGFEYGYSLDYPEALVLWEAQFGDFVNAAQVIVDQFIASAETKWRRLSGLVLLLPHGFEGMGPEHSSARLERFLQLAAEDNIQVVYPTTPAQYFHVLRRQALRRWRKPLVVLTPKSLLRHPQSVSTLDDLSSGRFRRVIAESDRPHVILCAGKIYYELAAKRAELKRDDVAIVRLEQLYPFPQEARKYRSAKWVQEEPVNMGAWAFIRSQLGEGVSCVARPQSGSPASGSSVRHKREQEELITQAVTEWPLN